MLTYDHPVTLRDDHGDLPAHADVLLRRLEELTGEPDRGRVIHGQHMKHAQRARVLADHLRGVLGLAAEYHYAGALALTRTALDHHLVDRLLFLATRWTEGGAIKKGRYRAGSVGRGMIISQYFFLVDQYDPFRVKKLAGRLATGFRDQQGLEAWAAESRRVWHRHFTYDKLRENLELNHLLRPRLGIQIDVHYAFLSAFVHGGEKAYELVYGHNIPNRVGTFDHCASELALLYVVALAAAELEVFGRMTRRMPRLHLTEWPAIEAEVAAARSSSSHFWFLSGEPNIFDRIQEIHTRLRIRPGSRLPKRLPGDPGTLDPRRVRYYPNPLERLVRLHHHEREMLTGLLYQSPFDRPDIRRW